MDNKLSLSNPTMLAGLIFALSGLLAACTPASPTAEITRPADPVPVITDQPAGPDLLAGVIWRLLSYADPKGNQAVILANTRITARFDAGQVNGSAGCNAYFAAYQVDGDRLHFRNAGLTEMFCLEPPGVMEQEDAFLQAFQDVSTFQVADTRLQLRDDSGMTLMTFVQEEIPTIDLTVTPESVNHGTAGVSLESTQPQP